MWKGVGTLSVTSRGPSPVIFFLTRVLRFAFFSPLCSWSVSYPWLARSPGRRELQPLEKPPILGNGRLIYGLFSIFLIFSFFYAFLLVLKSRSSKSRWKITSIFRLLLSKNARNICICSLYAVMLEKPLILGNGRLICSGKYLFSGQYVIIYFAFLKQQCSVYCIFLSRWVRHVKRISKSVEFSQKFRSLSSLSWVARIFPGIFTYYCCIHLGTHPFWVAP